MDIHFYANGFFLWVQSGCITTMQVPYPNICMARDLSTFPKGNPKHINGALHILHSVHSSIISQTMTDYGVN